MARSLGRAVAAHRGPRARPAGGRGERLPGRRPRRPGDLPNGRDPPGRARTPRLPRRGRRGPLEGPNLDPEPVRGPRGRRHDPGDPRGVDRGRRELGRRRVRRQGRLPPRTVRAPPVARVERAGAPGALLPGGVPSRPLDAARRRAHGDGGHGRPDRRTPRPTPARCGPLSPGAGFRHRLLDRLPARAVPHARLRGGGVRGADEQAAVRTAPGPVRAPMRVRGRVPPGRGRPDGRRGSGRVPGRRICGPPARPRRTVKW